MFKTDGISPGTTSSPGLFDSQVACHSPKKDEPIELKPVIKEKSISKIMVFYSDGTFQDIPVK